MTGEAVGRRHRGSLVLWPLMWIAGGALLWMGASGVEWHGVLQSVREARLPWLVTAVVANFSILLIWAALWRQVLPIPASVGYARMFEVASVSSAIMNTIPALVGHVSAVVLLTRRAGLSGRTATAVVGIDQLGEGLSKVVVLGLAISIVGLPAWLRHGAVPILTAVLGLLVGSVTVARFGGVHFGDTRAGRFLDSLRSDLAVLRSARRAAVALALALAMKGAEAIAIVGVMTALQLDLPFTAALVVLAAVNLATMLPISPGNLGTYEAGAIAAYDWLGVPPEAAVAAALVQHACFLIPAIGAGAAVLGGRGTMLARDIWNARAGDPGRGAT